MIGVKEVNQCDCRKGGTGRISDDCERFIRHLEAAIGVPWAVFLKVMGSILPRYEKASRYLEHWKWTLDMIAFRQRRIVRCRIFSMQDV